MAAGPTFEPIKTASVTSATSIIELTSISGSYTDLVLWFSYKSNSTNAPTLKLTFNGSTTGYSGQQFYGTGSTAGANRNNNAGFISIARSVGQPNSSGGTATAIININNYANTNTYKTISARVGAAETGSELDSGLWQNTSAITSIKIETSTSNDFGVGSTVTLYGITAA